MQAPNKIIEHIHVKIFIMNQKPLRLPNVPPFINDSIDILQYLAITPNDGIDSQRFSYWKFPKLDLQCGSFRSCWPLVKDRPFSFGVSGLGMGPSMGRSNPLIPVTFLVDTFGILRIPVIPSDYTTSTYCPLFLQKYVRTIVPFISDDHFFFA